MTGASQVRMIGAVFMFSVLLLGAGGVAAPRFLELSDGSATPVFRGLLYAAAAGLLLLMAAGPALAGRLAAASGEDRGVIVAMALAEGIALLGIVAGSLAGETGWIVAVAATGVLAILRIQASATT